jgi:hypothetical protein
MTRTTSSSSEAIVDLLNHPDRRKQIGDAARNRVRHHFLGPHHLGRCFELISQLMGGPAPRVNRRTNSGPGPNSRGRDADPANRPACPPH